MSDLIKRYKYLKENPVQGLTEQETTRLFAFLGKCVAEDLTFPVVQGIGVDGNLEIQRLFKPGTYDIDKFVNTLESRRDSSTFSQRRRGIRKDIINGYTVDEIIGYLELIFDYKEAKRYNEELASVKRQLKELEESMMTESEIRDTIKKALSE